MLVFYVIIIRHRKVRKKVSFRRSDSDVKSRKNNIFSFNSSVLLPGYSHYKANFLCSLSRKEPNARHTRKSSRNSLCSRVAKATSFSRTTLVIKKRPKAQPLGRCMFACVCYWNVAIICKAVTAHSSPLLPSLPPLRSCACKRLFVVMRPKITGVSYSTFNFESPAVTPSHI